MLIIGLWTCGSSSYLCHLVTFAFPRKTLVVDGFSVSSDENRFPSMVRIKSFSHVEHRQIHRRRSHLPFLKDDKCFSSSPDRVSIKREYIRQILVDYDIYHKSFYGMELQFWPSALPADRLLFRELFENYPPRKWETRRRVDPCCCSCRVF